MAQFRQSGADRFSIRVNGSNSVDQISARNTHKQGRIRRSGRSDKYQKVSVGAVVVIISLMLLVTVFALYFLAADKEYDSSNGQDADGKNVADFLSSAGQRKGFKVLEFGKGSVAFGRDSRYWDGDDRRRDGEYNQNASKLRNVGDLDGTKGKSQVLANDMSRNKQFPSRDTHGRSYGKQGGNRRSSGLYNEAGRDELKLYEAEYEASLKNSNQSREENNDKHGLSDGADGGSQNGEANLEDEYDDDGIDSHDARREDSDVTRHDGVDYLDIGKSLGDDGVEFSDDLDNRFRRSSSIRESNVSDEAFSKKFEKDSSLLPESVSTGKIGSGRGNANGDEMRKRAISEKKPDSRKRGKRHRFSGSSCEMKFLNSTAQLVEPLESRKFSRFTLQYTEVENRPNVPEEWEPRFAGHQSLQEREESFYAHDQTINCGFVKGPNGSPSTGFDLAEDDVRFMSSCHIAVSSCIFGNSDNLRTPTNKMVTRLSRKNVCFVMFVDENTLQTLSLEGQKPDRMGFIGLWKIVVVKNLPYSDMRRVGKVPKFLTHRLFPSARYSIWLDSKLRLQSDPLLILEYFLWRHGYEYAISNHYDRHCVWEEVARNKKLNKFNHTIIDQQFAFYHADGLKKFNPSDPDKLLPSYVPEGSFIVRAHTPMSNLFSCLWFNEIDRFTPRDQLSFAYTYLKLRRMNPGKPFHLNMFKDCERRSIAKLFRHRADEKRSVPSQAIG
ncbi:uncharacterized protein LOC131234911 [Magnolia sinica]|uniref:uncharacterized protein LOC131234911 n=1 Tax=Magnolia sinica TaxID=86752 RepID=UPI00265A4102|nr:uncharacterized protein LOC131234911 [Magnolia sinica]